MQDYVEFIVGQLWSVPQSVANINTKLENVIQMSREIVITDKAPKAIGPFSQAIKANGFVFCSGQISSDPESGELVLGPIAEQTKQIFRNISEVLVAGGSALNKVVKVSVFLKDMDKFKEMNSEYSKWFSVNPPARTTVQVARLPLDVDIEIDVIALQ
ncbi:MAG: RidA family protein [Candidatus Thorarchaeota archaeon]|jgi:2-iminobutanoate/2-iminopropanoate deaminase